MSNYIHIQDKLKGFIRKYYSNEMIKGSILFLSFGLLYLIFTLIVEYFLWLNPMARTILFWVFIGIEAGLLFWFILLPLMKLFGLRKGISEIEASKIIGRHFKEVDDKLLNILQLSGDKLDTDLLEASIEQKSKDLESVSFKRAINFGKNSVHLKYLLFPVLIWFVIWISGNNSVLTQSLNRVVHHKTAFSPPAPFYFEVLNEKLETIEDETYTLRFRTVGEIIPENIKIVYDGQTYYINSNENDILEYAFEFPVKDVEFYLEGNKVSSQIYTLNVLAAPKIIDFGMVLQFPSYINQMSDTISNTGNARIPEGTEVSWIVTSQNAETVDFVGSSGTKEEMHVDDRGVFSLSKKIHKDLQYQILSSNSFLKDFEKLSYELKVISDEYPKIYVKSDIDSVKRAPIQFLGQVSDDYGISRLQVIARNMKSGSQSIGQIDIGKQDFEEFFYVFPRGILLEEGSSYEIYFEIYDNDAIRGPKKKVSQSFYYHAKTQEEREQEILIEQIQGIEKMMDAKESSERMEKNLEAYSKKLKNKESTDWNDKKELDEFLEKQKRYQEMMDKNAETMKENLNEFDEENPLLEDKKEELIRRLDEMKDYQEKEELLKELEKLTEKLEKEDLLDRIDKLKEQSKQEKRSLERILELTKQFYVQKKSAQIIRKLEELSEEQLDLSTEELNNEEEQEKLTDKFDSIQKDFKELREQNDQLKTPLDIFESEPDEKLIKMDMKDAEELLEEAQEKDGDQQKKEMDRAKEKQRKAARRMDELSKKMESGLMEMEMQGAEENIKDLQQILKNLLKFSLDQEALMLSFQDVSDKNADFPEKLKEQIVLKEYFEHIDDSLYALSLRMVKISSKIQEDISSVHYNLDKSLENISENRIKQGMTNQQYTMTSANNLADLLSDILQNLQNNNPGSGKGKGKEGELSLPDIIKQQQGLMKKMKEGMNPQKGQGKKGKEEMSGEQFQMYQEQKMLKDQLRQLMDKEGLNGQQGKEAMQQMENLEKILLEKGIGNEALQRMQQLEHELLELEEANLKKNQDAKRKATTGTQIENRKEIDELNLENFNINDQEMLRRERLEMSPGYKRKVKEYFEINKE